MNEGLYDEEQSYERFLESHIQKYIIPMMNTSRGRVSFLTEEEIMDAVYRPATEEKIGERAELLAEIAIEYFASRELHINCRIASEIADVVYYLVQPNAPKDKLEEFKNYLTCELNVTWTHALEFCIEKYRTRIAYINNPNQEEQEYLALKSLVSPA